MVLGSFVLQFTHPIAFGVRCRWLAQLHLTCLPFFAHIIQHTYPLQKCSEGAELEECGEVLVLSTSSSSFLLHLRSLSKQSDHTHQHRARSSVSLGAGRVGSESAGVNIHISFVCLPNPSCWLYGRSLRRSRTARRQRFIGSTHSKTHSHSHSGTRDENLLLLARPELLITRFAHILHFTPGRQERYCPHHRWSDMGRVAVLGIDNVRSSVVARRISILPEQSINF